MAQPNRPTDTQHHIRMCIGNGLRPQIWSSFTKRFGIAKIAELYGATDGPSATMNPFNKVGACGVMLKILTSYNSIALIKVQANIIITITDNWSNNQEWIGRKMESVM